MRFLSISTELNKNMKNVVELDNKQEKKYVYETNETLSDSTENYKIIDENGKLSTTGVIVLNNIPISEKHKEAFEKRFLQRARAIESNDGFQCIRVLKPLEGDLYIILTQWDTKEDFENWQTSGSYAKAHKKRHTKEGLDQQEGVIKSRPFHKIYKVVN